MTTLLQDLKYGLRVLRKSPAFTLIAIAILAIGVGASTAVFGLLDAILLKPLPYDHPERIVMLWRQAPPTLNVGYQEIPWSRIEFQTLQASNRGFEHVAAFQGDSFALTGRGQPALLDGMRATSEFFSALGITPALGRTYTDAEDKPGTGHVVVLSNKFWRERFAADASVLGETIHLNSEPYTVIGVMPAGFSFPRAEEMPASFNFPREVQFWVPMAMISGPRTAAETSDLLAVVGRLKPGATLAQAQDDLNSNARAMERLYGDPAKGWFDAHPTPLSTQVAGGTRRPLLLVLMAVILVLLIASSNIASLLLVRSMARRHEFAVRAALGAARGRLARQLLTESLLLAGAGGALAILLAEAGLRFVKAFGPASLPRLQDATLNLSVFAFAAVASFGTGILSGLAPALAAARSSLADSLKQGGQRAVGGTSVRLRRLLPVVEIALTVVLLTAAGLVGRTFYRLLRVDPGFNPQRVLTFELSLPPTRYSTPEQMVAVYSRILDNLRAIPGVEAAGMTETTPMTGATEGTGIRIPGRAKVDPREQLFANYTIVSPGYFQAVGTPLLRGRRFLDSDNSASAPVVTVINQAMARRYWPNQDPIGKQVGPGALRFPAGTIIGVVADVKRLSLREQVSPEMYVLYTQKVWPSMLVMNFALRTASEPAAITAGAQRAVQAVDPDLPLARVQTLETIVDDSMRAQRFTVLLLAGFGAFALLLASVGLYGLISHSVVERRREIGVRMALGAQPRQVLQMVLGDGTRLAAAGVAIGMAAAFAMGRALQSFLYGIGPADPITFALAPAVLMLIALAASYLPARRATGIDPMNALRSE